MALQPGEEEQSPEARSQVSEVVAAALRQRGWDVDTSSFALETLKSDDRLRALVDFLRVRSGNLAEEMLNRPGDTKNGRYTLGDDVAGLGRAGQTDALVVVRSALLTPLCNDRTLYMDLLFADPQSGEILAFSSLARHPMTKLTTEKRVQEILKELKNIR
jgi:hypothetical protein